MPKSSDIAPKDVNLDKPSKELIKELLGLVSESAEVRPGNLRYHVWRSMRAVSQGALTKEVEAFRKDIGDERTVKHLTRYIENPSLGDPAVLPVDEGTV